MSKYSDEVKQRALSNWLDGMSDKDSAAMLDIPRKETIKDWRMKYEWKVIKERYQQMFQDEWERKRAVADAEESVKINERHRRTMKLMAGKILSEIQDGEPEETQFARIKTYKLAVEALKMIQDFERKIYAVDDQPEDNLPVVHTFRVEGASGNIIHIDSIENELPNQNPHEYTLPDDVIKKKLESDIPVNNSPIVIGGQYMED